MDKDKLGQTGKPSKTDGDIIPHILTRSQTDKISATPCYMKEHAFAESTLLAVLEKEAYVSCMIQHCFHA